MTSKYNEVSVDLHDAGRVLLEVVQTLRTFRTAGQHQGRHAISGTKVGVLHCLTQGEARLSDIARHLGLSVSVVSRAVESLEQDGLVQRRHDHADGRAYVISITDQGQSDLAQRYRYIAERFASVLQTSSPAGVEHVIDVLQQLNMQLEELTEVLISDERAQNRV